MTSDTQNKTSAIMMYNIRIYNDVSLENLNMEACEY